MYCGAQRQPVINSLVLVFRRDHTYSDDSLHRLFVQQRPKSNDEQYDVGELERREPQNIVI